jgi:small subunit ribosomal protein S6
MPGIFIYFTMAKNKSSNIPDYELLYIIPNKYSQDELNPIIEKIRQLIKDKEGNITFSEQWGKKKLAYPVKHFNHGYYNLVEFKMAGEGLAKVDRELRLMSEVLRHQIVKKEPTAGTIIEREKKTVSKLAQPVQPAPEKTAVKVDMKELDEKLDKILDSGDLL